MGGGHSLNDRAEVGVEIVCFCLFFIVSADSGKDSGCLGG